MFGLSFGELAIIAILALFILGPDRLPEAARTIGKHLKDLRKATDGLKDQLEVELYVDEKPAVRRPAAPTVPNVTAAAMAATGRPGMSGPPPAATAENVPGLEAALVEPARAPAPPAAPPPADPKP